ncbi:MAG: endonuclease [Bdellovibrionota bacterium]
MRFGKTLAKTSVTTLLAFIFLLSFAEPGEARGRNRHRGQKQNHRKNCDDFISRDQKQSFFDTYSTSDSRRDRDRNRNNNNQNNERYGQQNQNGKSSNVTFGDIRDKIYADISQNHRNSISYGDARERIMHVLDMRRDQRGTYVWDYYCQRPYRINSNQMPSSNELNVEHTWPQSRFSTRYPRDVQKTDLHHLFPTDSWANQLRGNMNFGYVEQDTRHTDANCKDSRVGYNKNHQERFQPPVHHRGSVARALFYFSIRYKLPIDAEQEAILRQWHKDDPVSADEIERNNKIEEIQGNRNPFIDTPDLVDDVPTFR